MSQDPGPKVIPVTKDGREGVQVVGSNARFYRVLSATTTEKVEMLPASVRQIVLKNDGSDDLQFNLDGNPAIAPVKAYSDSDWTYTGTWQVTAPIGYVEQSSITGDVAVFAPAAANVSEITLGYLEGDYSGIMGLELSADGGATWAPPSTIAGVSRSDGAVGTSLDTFDAYASAQAKASFTFYLPAGNAAAVWALRMTVTGTRNASASGNSLYLQSGAALVGYVQTVKPTETLTLDVATGQLNYVSPTSTTARLWAV